MNGVLLIIRTGFTSRGGSLGGGGGTVFPRLFLLGPQKSSVGSSHGNAAGCGAQSIAWTERDR